jgi:serine/threonine protein kinase
MLGKTISHYRVIDKLGEGGMGSVWKAEDTRLNRLVALKALSSHLADDDEARQRFIREAQAASALNDPHITTIHDLLDVDGQHFICMEYVEGKTIRDILETGHVSVRKAVDIILQSAEALGAAHRKGILHRDIKSANIMVSMEGNVKVMDFGLALLADSSQLTRTGTTMGTLAYSSPEQLTGRPYDERSEIWSLGVVLYELLTGQRPFRSASEGEVVFEIINNEQDGPSQIRSEVPVEIDALITRMLDKDPELRFQDCGELIQALRSIRQQLETSTMQHSAPLPGPAGGRRISRSTAITGAVAGILLVAAAALLIPFDRLMPDRRATLQPGPRDRVAVMSPANLTGLAKYDPWMGSVAFLLPASLERFRPNGLDPIGGHHLREALARAEALQASASSSLPESEVALEAGAGTRGHAAGGDP